MKSEDGYGSSSLIFKKILKFPWWISYKLGTLPTTTLQKKIENLAAELGINKTWTHKFLDYVIKQFALFKDKEYYGYHTLDHALESTYISVLASKNDPRMSYKDTLYILTAALLHDMDLNKEHDKPHELAVEKYIRSDQRIRQFIKDGGLDLDKVIAMIYRTTYPFEDANKESALKRIDELIKEQEVKMHYIELGWFLSVCERIAGYSLGDFRRAIELALRNAHALNWHPSVINRESVNFFDQLINKEQEMFNRVINDLPAQFRDNLFKNISMFKSAWEREIEIKSMIMSGKIHLTPRVEDNNTIKESIEGIIELYNFLPPNLKSIAMDPKNMNHDMLLITLRTDDNMIVGYAKGGPLEYYKLRKNTKDENYGKYNTIYLEPIIVKPGFWDAGGGRTLRRMFIIEAKKRGYEYLTSYNHRKVIENRIERGEPSQIVCKFDPDMLDYYRLDLKKYNPN